MSSNGWSAFHALTGTTWIKSVMVMDHIGTESLVQDLNGNEFRVPGTEYSINSRVYVEDGKIISEATGLAPGGTHYV